MKTLAALLLALCSAPALACDQVAAAKEQFTFSEMGTVWAERHGEVILDWGWEWDGVASGQRLRLLQIFARGDACLSGQARPISFYRKGKLVGTSLPAGGVHLLDRPASAHPASGVMPVASASECPK